MSSEHCCLICHQNVQWSSFPRANLVVDRNMEVFWLLGKVLKVPGEQLAGFLEGCPQDYLEGWIKICGQCGELVKECQVVYQRLLGVKRRWIECRLKVVGEIKETWEEDVARECRDFVKYEYESWRKPFADGDLMALELASKMVIKDEPEEASGASSDEEYWTFSPASDSDDGNNLSEDNEKDEDCKPEVNHSTRDFNILAPSKIDKGNYECAKCQKTFAKRLQLDRHTRSLCGTIKKPKSPVPGSELPSGSPICKKRIRSNLKRHVNRRNSIGKLHFECPKCQKRFPTNLLLTRHTKSSCGTLKTQNRDPKPLPDNKFRLKCPVPSFPQTWSNPNGDISNYRSHLATQHTPEEKAQMSRLPNFLDCLECGKSFRSFETGQIHLYEHDKTLKKPIVCDTCGTGFLHKANLKVHKETSRQCGKQKKLTIICDICGNGYASKNSLQVHIREKHKENKPVVCHICGKDYSSRKSFQRHVREKHEGIFKEKCEHCGKALGSKYKLKIHLAAVHKIGNFKGKEHKCPEEGCGKVFYSKGKATNHWYGVHKQGEPGFKCEQCGKAFYAPGYLSQHIRVVHKGYRWKPKSRKEKVAIAYKSNE